MKTFLASLLIICIISPAAAQTSRINMLKKQIAASPPDSNRVKLLGSLFMEYQITRPDTAMMLMKEALQLSQKISYRKGEADCLNRIGLVLWQTGNYSKALETHLKSLKIKEEIGDRLGMFNSLNNIGIVYADHGENRNALNYLFQACKVAEELKNETKLGICLSNIGNCYRELNQPDSALKYEQDAYELMLRNKDSVNIPRVLSILGMIHFKMGHTALAHEFYRLAIPYCIRNNDQTELADIYNHLAELYQKTGPTDSCINYARKAIEVGRKISYPRVVLDASSLLAEIYRGRDDKMELYYFKLAMTAKDSLFNARKIKEIQNLSFSEKIRQQELAEEKKQEELNRKTNLQLAGIAIFIPLLFLTVLLLYQIHIHRRVVETMSVLSILLLFEFILLLLHPVVYRVAHNSPVLTLALWVAIAALLAPLHHSLSEWIKTRIRDVKALESQNN